MSNNHNNNDDDTEIYNVNEYSDTDLYNMLDLNNPSDRELEAKILMMIDKYKESGDERLEAFFEDVYSHFFDEEGEHDDVTEGFVDNSALSADNFQELMNSSAPNTLLLNQNKMAPKQTVNLSYGPSMLNPLLKETQRRVVHIQSKYRDYTTYPNSTDFNFNLSDSLNKVVALRLHSVNIPYKWYNISNTYNANYFYIKGVSPGIQGIYDFKIEVTPGAYTIPELINAINASIAAVAAQYSEVEFGTTGITYNDITLKPTLTLDIRNIYTESSYYLHFPTSSSPFNTTANTRTIPGMLGYINAVRPFYNIYSDFQYALAATGFSGSIPKTYDDQDPFTVVIDDGVTIGNNYFTVINYQGPGQYDAATSTVLDMVTVTYTTVGQEYTRAQIVDLINTAISTNNRFSSRSDIQVKSFSYKNTDGSTTSLNQYVLTIHLNPKTTTNSTNMKTVVIFPDESTIVTPPIWCGPNSCFLFDEEQLAVYPNILIGENTPVQTLYDVTSVPTITYTCTKNYFSASSLNNIVVTVPTSASLGFPNGYTMNEYVGIDNGTTQYTNSAVNTALSNASYSSNITLDASMRYSIDEQRVISQTSIATIFNEYDYVLDLTNCILHTQFGLAASINIISPASNVFTNAIATSPPYIIDNTNDEIVVSPKVGLGNSAVPPYTIQLPTGTYSNLAKLNQAINLAFLSINGNVDSAGTDLNGLNMTQSAVAITASDCTFTYEITTQLTENDYIMVFGDTIPTPTTWEQFLGFISVSYSLFVLSSSANYAQVIAENIPYIDPSKTITITPSNNSFDLYPLSTIPGLFDDVGTNNITITIPNGGYSIFDLYKEINNQMSKNMMLIGSSISTYYDGANNEYSRMEIQINQTYTADDYELVFFDVNNVTLNQILTNGNLVFEATKWDLTIGWILGYHSAQIYNLSPTDPNNGLYVEENNYSFNIQTGIITLTADTPLDIYLYKDLYIILNDFTQNHLNDGVATIESIPTNVDILKSSNPANYTQNAETNTTQVGLMNSVLSEQLLSENRIYAANTIKYENNSNSTTKTYSNPPYLKDLFALIPLKPTSLKRGEIFAEFGGALQENERKYFGPVNIKKMSVQLMNDRGDIIDLNGANWSFSLIAEYLYNQTRI